MYEKCKKINKRAFLGNITTPEPSIESQKPFIQDNNQFVYQFNVGRRHSADKLTINKSTKFCGYSQTKECITKSALVSE